MRVCSLYSLSLNADQGGGVCWVCSRRGRDLDHVGVESDDCSMAQQPRRDRGEGVRPHAERCGGAWLELGLGLGLGLGSGFGSGLVLGLGFGLGLGVWGQVQG